jgi:hypothetical protein
MFEQILAEINRILGNKYRLFFEFLPQTDKAAAIEEHFNNIGVWNIETGSLQLLQGNKGMQVDTTLNLLMRINDKDQTSECIDNAINSLVSNANGIVYADDNAYKFVMSFGVQKTVGEVKLHNTPFTKRYYQYILPINVTIARNLAFGDEMQILLSLDGQEPWYSLDGVVVWEETPTKQLEAVNVLNEDELKNVYNVAVWGLAATIMYQPDNELHNTILDNERHAPHTVYFLKYGIGDETEDNVYEQRKVYVSANRLSGQRRQFITYQLSFSEAEEIT